MNTVLQSNGVSKIIYKGGNQIRLQEAFLSNGFTSNNWVTFLQAKQIGKSVKEGEHGVRLVKYMENKTKKGKVEVAVRAFTVFNFDQLEANTN